MYLGPIWNAGNSQESVQFHIKTQKQVKKTHPEQGLNSSEGLSSLCMYYCPHFLSMIEREF